MRIPIQFEKLSMYARHEEPCSIALPFAQGTLKDASRMAVLDGKVTLPSQTRVTAVWPDGSIKWLLMHFLADLPANQGKGFECCTESEPALPDKRVEVREQDGGCVIDTGAATIELNAAGRKGLFRSIRSVDGFSLEQILGPSLKSHKLNTYDCEIGYDGWEVLEAGPIRTVVQTRGKHADADGLTWFDYTARVYAYAGKPWIKLDYQIINKESEEEQTIHSLDLHVSRPTYSGPEENVLTGLGKSNYATAIRRGQSGERLSHLITAEELKYQGNEHLPEVMYGTFWGDWCDAQAGGFSITMYQAQQNFPKQLDVSGTGITAGIIPDGTKLVMLQGMAKTHSLYIHLHGPKEDLESVNVRSLQFQLPDRPIIDSAVYEQSGVLEPLSVNHKQGEIERTLVNLADNRVRAYGILHWGDGPDRNYTDQGRGMGEYVWTNNEYDLPHSMMLMYARKGERRFLDYLLVAAQHWMDIDICHYSDNPLRYQGQIPHSPKHVTDNPAVCHEWVEGLLDYYHMTGEWRALESAIGIGENVLRILDTPRFKEKGGTHARESGWALRSLGALYKETGDDKYMRPMEQIVDHFETWKNNYGAWMSAYTDHTVVRVPFMVGVAVNSLMRFYQIKPQERIKHMIIDAIDDLIAHTYLEDEGMFIYKELPSLIKIGTVNPTILESLSYAYEFTGDRKYLEMGKTSFKTVLQRVEREAAGTLKEISRDSVILWDGMGPKFFGQYYYPLFYYYRTSANAGITL